jgi:PAS domain S-box-containing protein
VSEHQENFFLHRLSSLESPTPQTCEIMIRKRDGSKLFVRMQSHALADEDGAMNRCLSAVMDVTERKRTEDELMRSRREFKALADNLPDIVLRFDADLKLTYANDSIFELMGMQPEIIIGKTIEHATIPEHVKSTWQSAVHRVLETGRMRTFEFEFPTGTGHRYFQARVVPEIGNDGKIEALIGVMTDITSQHIVEEELIKAKESAEKADRAKGRFLADMSHEIRTPLSGMQGMTAMLSQADSKEKRQVYVDMIQDSVGGLLRLVDDLLDLSKIEAGKLELLPEIFNVRECVERTIRPFALQAEEQGLDFALKIHDNVPTTLFGDPLRLGQIIMNLVGNALKFTQSGRVEVEVNLQKADRDAHLLFTIRDTGIGIPEDFQEHIFQSYSRNEEGKAGGIKGTGLGLAISKNLVERMGGEITVESAPGEGSIFYFVVRMHMVGAKAEAEKNSETDQGLDVTPRSILLAEDNTLNMTFLTHFLERAGHKVTGAKDGREVLRFLSEKNFDIVLMDIHMPKPDGLETTALIRNDTSGTFDPDIPIIALTAYAMKGDRERFLEAGMNDYITKPVDIKNMLEIVERKSFKNEPV